MSIDMLTMFLGWCLVINLGIFLLSSVILMVARGAVEKIHSRLFGVNESELPLLYFQYLGHYKVAIFMLNLAPYVALKLMT